MYSEEKYISKARKNHECAICQLPIVKGTGYYRVNCVEDNEHYSYAWHPECRFYYDKELYDMNDGCLPIFKYPRSECTTYGIQNGDSKLKEQIRNNLLIEFGKDIECS